MLCTICQTGFCWGCGKKHEGHDGLCGKINEPLENIEILAFPTEEFSRQRIENFQLHLSLKEKRLTTKKYKVERITHRFLAADRAWYFDNMEKNRGLILDTARGALVLDIVSRAVNICTQGRQFLINSTLRRENANETRRGRISWKYMKLMELDEAISNASLGKKWKEEIKRLATLICALEKSMKLPTV